MAVSKINRQRIVDETFSAGQSFVILSQARELAAQDLVEIHPEDTTVTNVTHKVRVRATQKLADEFPSQVVGNDVQSVPATANGATSNAQDTELVKDNPIMATQAVATDQTQGNVAEAQTASPYAVSFGVPLKGSIRAVSTSKTSKYPFAQLAPPVMDANGNPGYASFHIPVSADTKNGDPAKTFAGVVSTATLQAKKRAEKANDGSTPAKYVIRRVEANDPNGAGARVYRVQ